MCSSLDPVARSQSMPHALCFSLLLCFKPSSTQRPSLQTTCSKKTFLNFRPSPSLPFPFLPTERKGSVYYLLLCILFKSDAEPTSDLWSWQPDCESSFCHFLKSYHLSQNPSVSLCEMETAMLTLLVCCET